MSMKNDNVVSLYKLSDGSMSVAGNIPKPGDPEWSNLVLRNILRTSIDNEQRITTILYAVSESQLKDFVLYLAGNVFEMTATPMDEYHERGKQHFEELPDNKALETFILSLIFDMSLYLKRSEAFYHKLVDNLNKGQIYTLYVEVLKSANTFLEGVLDAHDS